MVQSRPEKCRNSSPRRTPSLYCSANQRQRRKGSQRAACLLSYRWWVKGKAVRQTGHRCLRRLGAAATRPRFMRRAAAFVPPSRQLPCHCAGVAPPPPRWWVVTPLAWVSAKSILLSAHTLPTQGSQQEDLIWTMYGPFPPIQLRLLIRQQHT